MPNAERERAAIWTTNQRRSVLVFALALLIFLAVEWLRKPAVLNDPLPRTSPRAAEIADRLDPNTADAAALAGIPQLGERHAAEIVEYRESFAKKYPGQQAFNVPEDLMRIKGIGLATVANLRPYLLFPQESNDHPAGSGFSPK